MSSKDMVTSLAAIAQGEVFVTTVRDFAAASMVITEQSAKAKPCCAEATYVCSDFP